MFSHAERCIYSRNQLGEVICQLRFPEILSIETTLPAAFQEAIRDEFPQYSSRKEAAAPKIVGTPGNMTLQNQELTTNYQFVSADGNWRVNLTRRFISLSCSRYTSWEEFAQKLDKPMAAFIQIYKPAFWERIGLRYLNFFSRRALDLEGVPFSSLISPSYLGILGDEDVMESAANRSSVDAELGIRGGCKVKIHAGPGLVKRGNQQDQEVKFIFDQDLYMPGRVSTNLVAGALQTLHSQADSIFRGAITNRLHNALLPEEI